MHFWDHRCDYHRRRCRRLPFGAMVERMPQQSLPQNSILCLRRTEHQEGMLESQRAVTCCERARTGACITCWCSHFLPTHCWFTVNRASCFAYSAEYRCIAFIDGLPFGGHCVVCAVTYTINDAS